MELGAVGFVLYFRAVPASSCLLDLCRCLFSGTSSVLDGMLGDRGRQGMG